MTYTVTGRLLLPIRASFFAFSSPNFSFSRSRNPFYGKCGQLKTLIKGIEPILQDCASKFQYRLSIQRKCVQSLCFSGGKLIMASMVGLPGWMNLHPHVSYALDEKHHADWGGNLYPLEDDSNNFWALLRRQIMRQQPYLYKLKSLYARKVEVEDYVLFCLARVELRNEKITLIGILGSWWVLQSSPCQGGYSFFKSRVKDKLLSHLQIIR
ncbi:PREDICTED: uncharacterized protein LOC104593133 isoform X2 [Nelumbo nucifera]|uniref:Uncharacterized protein n=2 Tax=Nelumbo nucifera TaxID=4432 RepID=A0A822YJY2_NELNU|nr:PREDICTED: uncharacterized protein LOC104593133 isoform X2 [Nelumbo nucifera]DAD34504.1 TPA_asm: hypothetical protein HUJ06_005144 [Nelumbo nucifera]